MTDKQKAKFSIDENQPTNWFEPLYAGTNANGEGVPWANMDTHPAFRGWLDQHTLAGAGKKALVVGCGMGDDAIELEALGFAVTAFDVAESAIDLCKQRFPESSVNFMQADLLASQDQWKGQFDFVLEIYTVQALPPKYEQQLIESISSFVAPQGLALVVAEVGKQERTFASGPPWILTTAHVDSYKACGLELIDQNIQDEDNEFGNMGTFVSTFKRPS